MLWNSAAMAVMPSAMTSGSAGMVSGAVPHAQSGQAARLGRLACCTQSMWKDLCMQHAKRHDLLSSSTAS
jgi:hypothetical protein